MKKIKYLTTIVDLKTGTTHTLYDDVDSIQKRMEKEFGNDEVEEFHWDAEVTTYITSGICRKQKEYIV